jgi:hypothetical protein
MAGSLDSADYNRSLDRRRLSIHRTVWHRMNSLVCQAGRQPFWLALMLALALSHQRETAAVGSTSEPEFDAASHAQVCHCGTRCRLAACCCGHARKSQAAVPRATNEEVEAATTATAPCLDESPCGEPGLPNSAPTGTMGRHAAITDFSICFREAFRRLAPPQTCFVVPPFPIGRIDRPPRARGLS